MVWCGWWVGWVVGWLVWLGERRVRAGEAKGAKKVRQSVASPSSFFHLHRYTHALNQPSFLHIYLHMHMFYSIPCNPMYPHRHIKHTDLDPRLERFSGGEDAVPEEEVGERAVRDGGAAFLVGRRCVWDGSVGTVVVNPPTHAKHQSHKRRPPPPPCCLPLLEEGELARA